MGPHSFFLGGGGQVQFCLPTSLQRKCTRLVASWGGGREVSLKKMDRPLERQGVPGGRVAGSSPSLAGCFSALTKHKRNKTEPNTRAIWVEAASWLGAQGARALGDHPCSSLGCDFIVPAPPPPIQDLCWGGWQGAPGTQPLGPRPGSHTC